MTNPVNADQLRVVVEMGDDYEPSERVAAALDELGAALAEDGDDDVGGFGVSPVRSFVYDSSPAGYQTGGSSGDLFVKMQVFNKAMEFSKLDMVYKW